ncbi:hypothetical protein [Streptomyces lienomycini]|uniref:hypothetical protein n=1 Tax=Streptomyces lienomycini TaxID=284035 RepID=UPI0022FE307D|nr:hypothetical protein [Streptomyces lienomycini]
MTAKQRGRSMLGVSATVAISLVLTGCGSVGNKSSEEKLGYTPKVQEIQTSKNQVNDISSRILDWMGVTGKTTEASAAAGICEAVDPDFKKYYLIHHPWSVYDVKDGSFQQAMENIRRELPKHGWKITRDGHTDSAARNPEIVAVNEKSHHTATIEWAKNRSGNLKQIISVDVNSRCYRAPEGTDMSKDR